MHCQIEFHKQSLNKRYIYKCMYIYIYMGIYTKYKCSNFVFYRVFIFGCIFAELLCIYKAHSFANIIVQCQCAALKNCEEPGDEANGQAVFKL